MKGKLLFYAGELLIVIIGVSIAFWLNQVGEERKEAAIRNTYFKELHDDISYDILFLEQCIKLNEAKIQETMNVVAFYEDAELNKDSIVSRIFDIGEYHFFKPRDFTYQSIITSGDFKLINDPHIKKELIRLHSHYRLIEEAQNNYLDALDNNFFPFLVERIDYLTGEPLVDNLHKSIMIKNHFLYTVNDVAGHIRYYNRAIKSAENLDSLITIQVENYEK